MPDDTLTPSPSPSERGEQKIVFNLEQDEAVYRAAASKVMIQIARNLRQRETSTEKIVWQALRSRRLNNLKFRRQHPIANTAFVVDFLCYEARLIIEIDGEIHNFQLDEDANRQEILENEGYSVLRFTNEQVKRDLENVLTKIAQIADSLIKQSESPSP